jgi:hypothetical protein
MSEAARRSLPDRAFFLLLASLAAWSLPSLVFCALEIALWLHSVSARGTVVFRLPPQTGWDHLFALQSFVYLLIARWNAVATLAASGLFVFTLLSPRWRPWLALALIPYAVLLCADVALRCRTALLP